ncbi:serine/threonine-protein kinase PEPKR2-like [Phragmites australis]|uniref:serine/threonine-protein kinase PEPKR2-like n=1 Tax=Phragmites australis TaxID=29695 RepID=UPI002D7712D7|nr:serine/threonine-protein kinase PEPKR2-like [Phragmites australis]
MESMPRKRKGAPPACSAARSLQDLASRKRACRECDPQPPCTSASSRGVPAVVMTAPAASGGAAAGVLPGRGLKRKVGCIEAPTRMGRRKRLEGEYDLGEEIGHGKFGSVRVCRAKAGGEEFACKALPKNGGDTAHREVEIMQHLSGHPGVVTLRAVFEDSDSFYLVMELCRGGRLLDEVSREGRLSERRAANVIRELMAVLKYCHEMGVVHRDIKPENVLLTKDGSLKLADFGLAVRVANGQKLTGVAGSPAYVAPEVLLGNYSQKVDIWAAGVLLHVLLMGTLPFQGNSVKAIFDAIKTVELDLHSGQWTSVSRLARDLIGQMLHRDATSRFDADDVLRHPWVLFYTECPLKVEFSNLWSTNKTATPMIHWERVRSDRESSSSESSSDNSEEQDECGIVDALTTAITQVRISEPKRSRVCSPANQLFPPSRNALLT